MIYNLDPSKVEFSKHDLVRKITLPKELTLELAYLLGFQMGDGYLKAIRRDSTVDYLICYDGHKVNEWQFYDEYLRPLLKRLFNVNVKLVEGNRTVRIYFRSKAVLTFLNLTCGVPLSPKKEMKIPKIILQSNQDMKAAFLRGLADTDFSLVFKKNGKYPVIDHGTNDSTFHASIKQLLSELGFTFYSKNFETLRNNTKCITYRININGKKNLNRWMSIVGFLSNNTLTRFYVWKEKGYLPKGTNINERISLLKENNFEFKFSELR